MKHYDGRATYAIRAGEVAPGTFKARKRQEQANGGTGCTSSNKGSSGKCVHTHIVGLGVMGSNCGRSSPLNLEGGSDEDSGDEVIGSGAAECKRSAPGFVAKVEQLLRMFGSIKYPVHVLAALSKDRERGSLEAHAEIASLEDVRPKCDEEYVHLKSVRVTALVPGPDLVEAVLKIKGCIECGVEAVTGDDWQEHGYFVVGETLLAHLSHMDATRRAVLSGKAISHAFVNLLRPLADNLIWMTRNKLAKG